MESQYSFVKRHIGVNAQEIQEMLHSISCESLNDLIQKTIPNSILLKKNLQLPTAKPEHEYLDDLKKKMSKNKLYKNFIGQGYYNTITPSVILRNIFENPGWYTQYTPYQAEISQGRLEALMNFQTVISDLTGFEVANASLLDESTAAFEAITVLARFNSHKKPNSKFFISQDIFQQTLDLIKTKAKPLNISIDVDHLNNFNFHEDYTGVVLQYPNNKGEVIHYASFIEKCNANNIQVILICDIMSLILLESPATLGADIAIGNTQRFGVPMGYGGPHAAFFACKKDYLRFVPGRIIGLTQTQSGASAFRMALQTREQHIRREKATSNICTAQALLAIMASMYAVYHGPKGLKAIATLIHKKTCVFVSFIKNYIKQEGEEVSFQLLHTSFFDTTTLRFTNISLLKEVQKKAEWLQINLYYDFKKLECSISIDEATSLIDIQNLLKVFIPDAIDFTHLQESLKSIKIQLPTDLLRTTPFLKNMNFHKYHSETAMMRYIKKLEQKDLALNMSMIPLGSCTMKLNAATEMMPLSWPEVAHMHPFAPLDQCQGYQEVIQELHDFLCELTGLEAVSFQPNSGAQGEYAGLLAIRDYHIANKQGNRNIMLIPSSAHGTNPASATLAGFKIVTIQCDTDGNINIEDIKTQTKKYNKDLGGLMITYPSTHGVFEEDIELICSMIHENGGLVYLDGANMNAQIGLTNPKIIGADVCHLNLHKTFAIPHGGGGPGMGPIAVNQKLKPFLPNHWFVNNEETILRTISSAPWGSASILTISHAYIAMLGLGGLTQATKIAILNANYIKSQLQDKYKILYEGSNGYVAHELLIDLNEFKKKYNIEVEDFAKRLIDYGFHAPTISWPVLGTMMIEPTESEPKQYLDYFCDALNSIYDEITQEDGKFHILLKNSPFTVESILNWKHDIPVRKAIFPLEYVQEMKFWSPVDRVNHTYGDRNFCCTL